MVVSALVNPTNGYTSDRGQLGGGKNNLDNSSPFYSGSGLVGVLFVALASADKRQWHSGTLSAIFSRFYASGKRLIVSLINCP